MTQGARLYSARTFQFFMTYSILTLLYLVLTMSLTRLVRWIERRTATDETHTKHIESPKLFRTAQRSRLINPIEYFCSSFNAGRQSLCQVEAPHQLIIGIIGYVSDSKLSLA